MMHTKRLAYLFGKYFNKTANQQERDELFTLISEAKLKDDVELEMQQQWNEFVPQQNPFSEEQQSTMFENVLQEIKEENSLTRRPLTIQLFAKWTAAASIAILFTLGGYFYYHQEPKQQQPISAFINDVAPGRDGATLVLADGRKIIINEASSGTIAKQAGVNISKSKTGQIRYEIVDDQTGSLAFNTILTNRGQQTQILLPDGTLVYLNAESSLKFPTSFAKTTNREVALIGEGYFEVAKDKKHPFVVNNKDQRIEVLGTHFNVKAYSDENVINTTLLEGSVRISSRGKKILLKPGDQASNSLNQLLVNPVGKKGIAKVMAWKEGRFNFQDANLQEVMKQLARWYDIEIIYEKGVPNLEFIGEIERSLPLSEVLKGLKMSGVNFRLEKGKRLIISP